MFTHKWQMVQIKEFTAPQKMPNFPFQDMQTGLGGTKHLAPPSAARKLMRIEANPFYL